MNTTYRQSLSRPAWVLLVLGTALTCTSALAEKTTTHAQNMAQYQQDRAECMKGQTNQSREDCLYEARSVLRDAEKGTLDDGKTARDLARNQRLRCDPLPVEERKDCMARMAGQGTISGSAESGGILRELVTIEPAPTTTTK